jgi:hypothetical protein
MVNLHLGRTSRLVTAALLKSVEVLKPLGVRLAFLPLSLCPCAGGRWWKRLVLFFLAIRPDLTHRPSLGYSSIGRADGC